MKIYIAAPLFNEMELTRNEEICNILEGMGYDTYLPQRDGGIVGKLEENATPKEANEIEKLVFSKDINAMNECEMILFLLDGIALDEGSCFELGYMYAQGKRAFGYKTDCRNFSDGKENLMIQRSLEVILRNREQLKEYFEELRK